MKQSLAIVFGIAICVGTIVLVSVSGHRGLPDCGDAPVGPHCILSSKIRPQSVVNLQIMVRTPSSANRFDSRTEGNTNGIHFTTVRLPTNGGIYSIHVFQNSVNYWFRPDNKSSVALTLADHDFDGFVDHGHIGDIMDENPQIFDEDLKQGLQYRKYYQELYERHFTVIADQLGL